jgi:uncharacterized protein (TIGR00730 family)
MSPIPSKRFGALCVFCGSNLGTDTAFAQAARDMGALLAAKGTTLIYGGGKTGLMGALADSALSHGGRVIGVIPRALVEKEVAHDGLTEQRIVSSMHERKAVMAQLAEGFIALPGGYGTFEEFFEVLTWTQLGLHAKPFGLLNVSHFYTDLLRFLDHATACELLRAKHRELVIQDSDAERLLARLSAWTPVNLDKWIKAEQT